MSEEQKAAQEAQEETTDVETSTDDETSQEESQQEVDYKALLESERKAREDAEKAAADLAFKLREKKRKGEEDYEDEEGEKPLTASQLQAILAEERQATEKKLMSIEAEKIASSLAGSDEEKEAILAIHKNRTFPAHLSLQDQLEESYVIANRKKILGENSELKRALKGKEGVNKDTSSYQDQAVAGQPKLSPDEQLVLNQSGFKWNPTSRRFEKKLSNGNILARDSKTKKTFLIK